MNKKNQKHRVVVYRWERGVLHFEEIDAESFEHAGRIARERECFEAKIYDCDDILVDNYCPPRHHDHYA